MMPRKRKSSSMAARAAGYWEYRQRFIDADLLGWHDAQFGRLQTCQLWSSLGFTIAEAKAWRAEFCNPIGACPTEAADWKSSGYTPEDALKQVRKDERGPRTMRTR